MKFREIPWSVGEIFQKKIFLSFSVQWILLLPIRNQTILGLCQPKSVKNLGIMSALFILCVT